MGTPPFLTRLELKPGASAVASTHSTCRSSPKAFCRTRAPIGNACQRAELLERIQSTSSRGRARRSRTRPRRRWVDCIGERLRYSPMPNIKLLLFDLGGVLVDFSGPRDLAPFLRTPATPDQILERWTTCPRTREFEAQRISAEDWASRFVKEWDVALTPDEYLKEFSRWSRGFFDGVEELLATLRPRFRLAALSNSNPIHWQRNAELGIPREFEFALSSHELGCCKPDKAIFTAAAYRAKLQPNEVFYFDDVETNVVGAREAGFHARWVQGVQSLRACLREEGLL